LEGKYRPKHQLLFVHTSHWFGLIPDLHPHLLQEKTEKELAAHAKQLAADRAAAVGSATAAVRASRAADTDRGTTVSHSSKRAKPGADVSTRSAIAAGEKVAMSISHMSASHAGGVHESAGASRPADGVYTTAILVSGMPSAAQSRASGTGAMSRGRNGSVA
jgi:hypothetical protein